MEGLQFLKGCVDYHLHVYPSMMSRYCDIVEVAELADKAGYRAIVHKDHHITTGALAAVVKKHLFADSDLLIFGSMALNNTVGGLNLPSVKSGLDFGAKVVWLPTASAKNHVEFTKLAMGNFPKVTKAKTVPEEPIVLIGEDGELTAEAKAVLDLLADYPGVAIGTGHGVPAEVDAVVRYCGKLGILNRVFVDHPNIIIRAPLEDICRWAEMGAYIELTAAPSCPPNHDVSIQENVELIRAIGPERVALASDLGQTANGNPIEAYGWFLNQLYQAGVSDDEIHTMVCENPAKLLSLD